MDFIANDLKEGGKIFGTKIHKVEPLANWEAAMEESVKVASQGKILL